MGALGKQAVISLTTGNLHIFYIHFKHGAVEGRIA